MAQSGRPNLFDHGLAPLTRAALGWLISWAEDRYSRTDAEVNSAARKLLGLVYEKHGRKTPKRIHTVEVNHGCDLLADDIPVLATINGRDVMLFEDKTGTMNHSEQVMKYRLRLKKEGRLRKSLMLVNVQMWAGCDYSSVREAGYQVITCRELIEILSEGKRPKLRNATLADFMAYLRSEQALVDGFWHLPLDEWCHCAWYGFFMELREWLGEGRWGDVANTIMGLAGFWWHWRGDKATCQQYLQIEEARLFYKIFVPEKHKSKREELRQRWYKRIMARAKKSKLTLKKSWRRWNDDATTVAVLDGDYRAIDREGRLDIKHTVGTLRKCEKLLDEAKREQARRLV